MLIQPRSQLDKRGIHGREALSSTFPRAVIPSKTPTFDFERTARIQFSGFDLLEEKFHPASLGSSVSTCKLRALENMELLPCLKCFARMIHLHYQQQWSISAVATTTFPLRVFASHNRNTKRSHYFSLRKLKSCSLFNTNEH